jgi:DNA invertase Pin-like site-specific DNA recombinase
VYRGGAKIRTPPGAKRAVVYVRQAARQPVLEHRTSTARQSAWRDDAVALGWPATRVVSIDEEQGQRGASAPPRHGVQRRLAAVTLNHVGLGLGLEMSRLARRSKDWHQRWDGCALVGPLLADQDGGSEANEPQDRLL